jgi:hypothetical protein
MLVKTNYYEDVLKRLFKIFEPSNSHSYEELIENMINKIENVK